ncbi:MAG: hypothetical protein WKF96_18105 [Solirubrobacteraceae bacterium]
MKTMPPWAEDEEPREVAEAAAPAPTIHLWLGRKAMGGGYQIDDESMIDVLARRDDPDLRAGVLENMNAGWYFLGLGCVAGLVIFGLLTEILVGSEARNVVLAAFGGLTFFCLAGNATILYRRYYFIPQARRLAQTNGFSNPHYINAMRHALPPNRTLVWQAVAGVVAFSMFLSSI